MITILNKGAVRDSDIGGWHMYELRIGTQLIARFEHQRIDGLAKCLRAAADAVEKKQGKLIDRLESKALLKKHQQENGTSTGKTSKSEKCKSNSNKNG